jgi:hypothetical protein
VSRNNLERSFVTTCLGLGSLMVAVLGVIQPSAAQLVKLKPIEIVPGLPDLTVQTRAAPTRIYGGTNLAGINESSTITITVHNRLTAPQLPQRFEGTLRLFGSEAKGVSLSVSMPAALSQVGAAIPGGFQCAATPTNHYVFCWGGNIPAGGSVEFQVDVIGEYGCGFMADVRAVVDPHNWIPEASDTNNEATSTISVSSLC